MVDESRWRKTNLKNLPQGAHIHLMGICGTAMASLAGLLRDQGYKITGSDQGVYPPMSTQLADLGITITEGYEAKNLEPKPDLVIVGNVIRRQFEESQALLNSDIPFTSLPVAMGEFAIDDRQSLVVAGTHGKTTTTSILSWVAEVCEKKPGFLIGGIPKNFERSFKNPQGNVFVIEGDEYDTAFFDKVPKFIHYKPKYVILTGVEFDHIDIYDDIEHVKKAFRLLMDLIPDDGVLVVNGDNEIARELSGSCKARKIIYYGKENCDYKYTKVDGELVINHQHQVKFPLYGEYNLANATAAFALAIEMGWPQEKIVKALESFRGVKRRQEIIGSPNDITIIEDFAHHPTAVAMTVDAVQEHFPKRRVYSVFEPRSAASRRKVFQDDYAEALSKAQHVLLAMPFNQTSIPEEDRFSSEELQRSLQKQNVTCDLFVSADDIANRLKELAKPGDVILIMSNGGFGGLYGKLLKELES